MSFEDRDFWWFGGEGGCNLCQDKVGLYHVEPQRPHEACKCAVITGEVRCEEISRTTEVFDQYELLLPIGWVPRGGTTSQQQTWSTGTTVTGTAGANASGGGVGVSVGGSVSQQTTTGGSQTVTFHWDEEEGGDSQQILARYEVTVYQETVVWVAHWSETPGGVDEQFETVDTWEEREFVGYDQIGV